jgi:hypothetical protein
MIERGLHQGSQTMVWYGRQYPASLEKKQNGYGKAARAVNHYHGNLVFFGHVERAFLLFAIQTIDQKKAFWKKIIRDAWHFLVCTSLTPSGRWRVAAYIHHFGVGAS